MKKNLFSYSSLWVRILNGNYFSFQLSALVKRSMLSWKKNVFFGFLVFYLFVFCVLCFFFPLQSSSVFPLWQILERTSCSSCLMHFKSINSGSPKKLTGWEVTFFHLPLRVTNFTKLGALQFPYLSSSFSLEVCLGSSVYYPTAKQILDYAFNSK